MPIMHHYEERGLLVRVDGNRSIEAVRLTLCSNLGGVVHGRRHDHWHVYISDHLRSDDGREVWHGRTLCGQFASSFTGRVRGREEDFLARPCRRCLLELRPRQRPIATPPTSMVTDQGACELLG
jgi:hypothetical protein